MRTERCGGPRPIPPKRGQDHGRNDPHTRRCPLGVAPPGTPCRAGTGPGLDADQLATPGQALADAMEYRQPAGLCADCDGHPAGLCAPHVADLDRADAYAALARQLGT
ncbi:MAG TPA: hypothetical protein VN714_13540 [Trebonia sp.]|nr:hypothetical protein [Trebonia sp.]